MLEFVFMFSKSHCQNRVKTTQRSLIDSDGIIRVFRVTEH